MDNRPWLDNVRQRLVRQALPPGYIQRFMEELSDHLNDLMEENMETNPISRLGQPEQVADNAGAAYRRRSFLGRHPVAAFLVFGISPPLMFYFMLGLMVFGVRGVSAVLMKLLGISDAPRMTPPGVIELMATDYLFSLLWVVVPVILTAIVYCAFVKWSGVAGTWLVVSCVVLAAVVAMHCWYAGATDLDGRHGVIVRLWLIGLHGWIPPSVVRPLLQMLTPLAVGWWFMRREHDQRRLQLAS